MDEHNKPFSELYSKLLVIDIETVSMSPDYESLPEIMQAQWDRKALTLNRFSNEQIESAQLFQEKAGIYSEFAKVVCISIGRFVRKETGYLLRIKSYYGDDEKQLLSDFLKDIFAFESKGMVMFCGHNIKEFDLPFICRRSLLHGLDFPKSFQLSQIKPWNNPHIDTLELWRFGDYKNYVSLDLLAAIFEVKSSKDEMDGSMVSHAYWQDNNLEGIVKYCGKDVGTTASVYQKMKGDYTPLEIEIVN